MEQINLNMIRRIVRQAEVKKDYKEVLKDWKKKIKEKLPKLKLGIWKIQNYLKINKFAKILHYFFKKFISC